MRAKNGKNIGTHSEHGRRSHKASTHVKRPRVSLIMCFNCRGYNPGMTFPFEKRIITELLIDGMTLPLKNWGTFQNGGNVKRPQSE